MSRVNSVDINNKPLVKQTIMKDSKNNSSDNDYSYTGKEAVRDVLKTVVITSTAILTLLACVVKE
tara:strand:+ start:25080 stop:25274 length:195 start_codon:yes stop_codon:yes gene_type:complete